MSLHAPQRDYATQSFTIDFGLKSWEAIVMDFRVRHRERSMAIKDHCASDIELPRRISPQSEINLVN